MARSVQRVHASSSSPLVVLGTNEVVPSPAARKLKSSVEPEHSIQGSVHLSPFVNGTRSRSRKKQEQTRILKETHDKSVMIELNLREEIEGTRESSISEIEKGNKEVI